MRLETKIRPVEKPLTTGKVAAIAGISYSQVWVCIKKGQLKAFQMDERGWHYVWRKDLNEWLKARERRRLELEEKKRRRND